MVILTYITGNIIPMDSILSEKINYKNVSKKDQNCYEILRMESIDTHDIPVNSDS